VARNKWRKVHASYTLRSDFEKRVATNLDTNNISYTYEEDKIPYIVPESKHTYNPDFKLYNGIFVEVKGNFDTKSRQKMALVIEQNPEADIRMVFMSDNKISKSSKTRYSDWCIKRGVDFCIAPSGKLPDEWLIENPIRKITTIKEIKCRKKPQPKP
jgi:hypothetical protein